MAMFYSSWPIILLAVFDRDVTEQDLRKQPKLYRRYSKGQVAGAGTFWTWVVHALVDSVVIFALPVLTTSSGWRYSFIEGLGGMAFGAQLGVVAMKLVIHQRTWNGAQIAVWVLSILAWYGSATWWCLDTPAVISAFSDPYWQWVSFPKMFATGQYWAVVFLVVVSALSKDVVYKGWSRMVNPQLYHRAQESRGGSNSWIELTMSEMSDSFGSKGRESEGSREGPKGQEH